MAAPEVFYSYAHSDEPLFGQLRKHLAALERAQLISGWYDRKIEPGSQWAAEIQAALERADIILLLVSADFIASDYCSNIEVPFALKRAQAGAAVIPIILRPVAWADLPISRLQALPTGAKPVTTWPSQDEAFTDIATHLRELIYARRLKSAPAPAPAASVTEARMLDAAVASSVALDEPAEVVTMIRRVQSDGLKAILAVETSFAAKPEDVRSSEFEVEFQTDPTGKLLPAALELTLESPGCDPPTRTKKLRVPPAGDSPVCVFLFTPKKTGRLTLSLEVQYEEVEMGSSHLVTTATGPVVLGTPPAAYSLTSLPLNTTISAPAAMPPPAPLPDMAAPPSPPSPSAARPDSLPPPPSPPSMAPPMQQSTGAPPPPSPSMAAPPLRTPPSLVPPPKYSNRPQQPPLSSRPPSPPIPATPSRTMPPPASKSWLSGKVMTVGSALALVLVAGVTLLTLKPGPKPPENVTADGSPNGGGGPTIALSASHSYQAAEAAVQKKDFPSAVNYYSAAIAERPNNAELYVRRAEAFQALKRPDLAKRDVDHSLALAPNNAHAHILKADIAQAEANHDLAVKEYEAAKVAPNITPEKKAYVEKQIYQVKQKQMMVH